MKDTQYERVVVTEEHLPRIEELRRQWRHRAATCTETDKALAERGLRDLFQAHGYPPIEEIVWCPSPRGCYEWMKEHGVKRRQIEYCRGGVMWPGLAMLAEFLRTEGIEGHPVVEAEYALGCSGIGYYWPIAQDDGTIYRIVASESPVEIHTLGDTYEGHRDGGPWIRFRDGWALYALWNTEVPEWVAMTPAEDMDPAQVLAIENVAVRSVAIRKLGMERLIDQLPHSVVDEATFHCRPAEDLPDDGVRRYRLLDVDLAGAVEGGAADRQDRLSTVGRMLQMEYPGHPGIYCIEGVPNEITTCAEAIWWRAGLKPEQIAEGGEEWYQQGDVVILPEGATKYRPYPSQMT